MEILEHQVLEMKNVLSVRKKMDKNEHKRVSLEITELLKESGADKVGPPVTATYSVEGGPKEPIIDCEILIPLNKIIEVPQGFVFKDRFLLVNAVKVTHTGDPSNIHKTLDELNHYVLEHRLLPISVAYNVATKEPESVFDINNTEIDIYVSVSPNIV